MREKEAVSQVIFIRHGNTDFPENRIYSDEQEDPALNELGKEQAARSAGFFSGRKIKKIYSSPSRRTLMTAKSIAKQSPAEIVMDSNLKERHFGNLEGLYFQEIEDQFPEEYSKWKSDPIAYKPLGGESVYDMQKRVCSAVDRIVNKHLGEFVVVVTHVGPIRMIVSDAFQIPIALYRQLSIDNASLTKIDYGKQQNNFIFMNRLG